MWYRLVCTLIFLSFLSSVISVHPGYIWRDYDGEIPEDAITAGKNHNGDYIYIGQAYIKNCGLFPVQITSGTKTVYAAFHGAHKADDFIKILAGRQEEFTWVPTTSKTLHLDLIGTRPVFGGHTDGLGKTYVGKFRNEGGIQMGKVNAFIVGAAELRWLDKNMNDVDAQAFEVLTYQGPGIKPTYVSRDGKNVDKNM